MIKDLSRSINEREDKIHFSFPSPDSYLKLKYSFKKITNEIKMNKRNTNCFCEIDFINNRLNEKDNHIDIYKELDKMICNLGTEERNYSLEENETKNNNIDSLISSKDSKQSENSKFQHIRNYFENLSTVSDDHDWKKGNIYNSKDSKHLCHHGKVNIESSKKTKKIVTNNLIKIDNNNTISTICKKIENITKSKINGIETENRLQALSSRISSKDVEKNFFNFTFLTKKENHSRFASIENKNKFSLKTNTKSKIQSDKSTLISEKINNSFYDSFEKNDIIILNSVELPFLEEEYPPDSFCEAFFGVGLPYSNLKIIDNSENFASQCNHENCGIFSAYYPEITFRVPSTDNKKFELNSTIASICFPFGIKICFHNEKNDINPIKNFLIITKKEVELKFYIMTYYYYEMISLNEFKKLYDIDLINEFSKIDKLDEERKSFVNEMENINFIENYFSKKFEIRTKLINDNVYLPKCICLLSKFSFANQMEKCLETILKMSYSNKYNSSDINKLILHLIKEVPIPPSNNRLLFSIPLQSDQIEISGPQYMNLPILNFHLKILLDLLSVKNIILIHHLMLCEQKIIFISDKFYLLSEVMDSFLVLFYPFAWTYPFIPILSEELLKYLQCFLPFIMGIPKFRLDQVKEYLNENEVVFMVFLDSNDKENNIENFSLYNNKKKKKLLENIPAFPVEIYNDLTKDLNKIKKIVEKKTPFLNLHKIDRALRETFARSIVKMFGDYRKFVSFLENIPLFNKDSFFKTKSKKDIEFYDKVIESQYFNYFIQKETKENYPFFYFHCHKLMTKNKKSGYTKFMRLRSISFDNKINYNNSLKFQSDYILEDSNINENIAKFYENNNLEYLNTFVITPYFDVNINESNTTSTINFIFNNEDNKLIIPSPFCKFFKRFLLPEENFYKEDDSNSSLDKSIIAKADIEAKTIHLFKIYQEGRSRGINIIRTNNKKEMEEKLIIMSDILRKIFTSKPLTEAEKIMISNYFKIREARNYFSKLIFQSKFKQENSICLGEKSFNDLSYIIFNILLEISDKYDYEDGRLLTKSCFYYYKNSNRNESEFIFTDIIKKKGKFSVWQNHNFWSKWFDLEIEENELTTYPTDDFFLNIFNLLSKIMIKLKFELKFILQSLIESIAIKKLKASNLHFLISLETIIKKQLDN